MSKKEEMLEIENAIKSKYNHTFGVITSSDGLG